MCNDYIPFTGGYAWSNPYEITRYVRKLSCIDGDTCQMEILCKDEPALSMLYGFIKSLDCDEFIQVTENIDPKLRARINIETRHKPLAASIKKFVDDVNRQPQTKPSNMPVFQYGHDVIPLGQVEEVKIDPQGIKFTCNVGRKNGKSMANKDLMDALAYSNYAKKDIEIIKEMKDNMIGYKLCPVPKKIIFSGPKCVVLWVDGTKTIVSCSENDWWDEYAAYCAALAKKLYGTTSAVHRMVDKKSNAKEYIEAKVKKYRQDLAEAMKSFIEEYNDESSEH